MRNLADANGTDLLVIDTGDRIEGNGLYDASKPRGRYQYDIYSHSNADLISVGNHELYRAYSADREYNTTVPNYRDNYIASNLDYIDESGNQVPLAQRYRKFKTKNQGINIVAFGFLFDFTGNANNTVVQPVEDTIKEDWFQKAIREKPDLFVVIGHVGLRMEEFKVIFTAIRKQNWHIPIVFFGGHAHVRDARRFDSKAFAIASGRYLETIGWVSIDDLKGSTSPSFTRRYIDSNLYGFQYHTGLNETTFPTRAGTKVTEMIAHARKKLDLDYRFGCAPKNLWMHAAKYPSEDNIYTWITDKVFPDIITRKGREDKPRIAITNTGGIRFDIFKGPFTRDSIYTVSPFNSGFRYIKDVPYKAARKVIDILNSGGVIYNQDVRFLTIPEQMFPMPETKEEPRLELRSKPSLTYGYTTKDDIGDDGDDTVHEPVKRYPQPNAIQGTIAFPKEGDPETVDFVFLDFTQPWIVEALNFAGFACSDAYVEEYRKESLTSLLTEWISENWKC